MLGGIRDPAAPCQPRLNDSVLELDSHRLKHSERLRTRHHVASASTTQPCGRSEWAGAIAAGRALVGAAGVRARPSWLEFALGRSAKNPFAACRRPHTHPRRVNRAAVTSQMLGTSPVPRSSPAPETRATRPSSCVGTPGINYAHVIY